MPRVLVVHGPNLNMLGMREPQIYGSHTLDEINAMLREVAEELGVELRIMQSNFEGELVEAIHKAHGWADAIILNPAGYTHTSVVLRGAQFVIENLARPATRWPAVPARSSWTGSPR